MNERIIQLRKHLNLSQEIFGKAIGVSQRTISTLENGLAKLTDRNFDAICREFNVNPTWLKTGEGEMFDEPKDGLTQLAKEFNLNENDLAIIKSFAELPPEYRKLAVEFAKNFVRNMQANLNTEIQERKPDDQLSKQEKMAIMEEEFDAEEGGKTSFPSIGTSGIRKSRRLPS